MFRKGRGIGRWGLWAVILLLGAGCAHSQYVYHSGVDWVKLSHRKGTTFSHPREIAPETMKGILASVRYAKKIIFLKDMKRSQLLGDEASERLAVYMSRAFALARPDQEVSFSIVIKDPQLTVFRDDRITIGHATVQGNEMVIEFDKLQAKLIGDYGSLGKEAQMVQRARSVRTALELGPGQKGSYGNPDVVIFDLAYPWGKEGAASAARPRPEPLATTRLPASSETPEERLRTLKQMLDDELITAAEYEKKKAEILKEL